MADSGRFVGKRAFAGGARNFVDAAACARLYRSRRMNGTEPTLPGSRSIARELALMILVALFLAGLGPFGMYAEPFGRRLAEWLLFSLGGYLFFRPVLAGGAALARATRLPLAIALAAAAALAAFPTTLLVAATLSGWRLRRLTAGALIDLYPQVLLVGGAATILLYLLARRRAHAVAAMTPAPEPQPEPISLPPSFPEPAAPSPASFLDRLPPALGRDLLCVENEDHYVRAHTAAGSTLILMRLRDAVAELETVEGLRVHRGWWVARAAVAEVVRRERAVALRLVNGLEVPVARAAVPELRAAGWLP